MMQYKYEIPALNTEKVLNKIIKKHQIFGLKKDQASCIFYCKAKSKNNIDKVLKDAGVKVSKSGFVGLGKQFKNATKIGIIAGILVSLLLWICSSFFVTNVIIIGNTNYTQSEIYKVLQNQNIKKWSLKSNINLNNLESEIQSIKHVSYVSTIIKGNSLVINVKEQLTNSEVVSINNYEPLVSCVDGKITSIKLIQGTLNVKVGDIIKTGDVLVNPYIKTEDKTLSVQPIADIVCDVWYTAKLEVKDVSYKKIKTGKSITNYTITAFGLEIYKKEQDIKFLNYEVFEKELYLSQTLVPIKIKYKTYNEYINQKTETNFEQNKQIYIEQTRQMSLLNVKDYDIIKDESYSISKLQDSNIITYTMTVNKKIC